MQRFGIDRIVAAVLLAVAAGAFIMAILSAFGTLKVNADEGTKFFLSLSIAVGVVLMFRDRLTKVILPGGITAELAAVRKSVQDVAAATEEIKSRQVEIAAPQMAPAPQETAAMRELAQKPIEDQGDKNKGRFGRSPSSNGLELSATVQGSDVRPGWFRIDLVVSARNRTLDQPVEFHLHETFVQPMQVVKPSANQARLTVLAWGAFTVGAIADQGKTRLELDLAADASFPRSFREK